MIWIERAPSPSAAFVCQQHSHVRGSQRAKVYTAERRKDMQTQCLPVA
jgi:hypothetical protein